MQRASADTDLPDRSPRFVWDTVVRITNGVANEEAKAIRILLYLAILSGKGISLGAQLRWCARFCRQLALPTRKKVSAARRGRPLFAFLHDTPANTNNLLPVFQAAEKRGWHPSVLMGNRVELSELGLNGATGSVSVTDLMAMTRMEEWFTALAGARQHFSAVCAEFERKAPHWTRLIQSNRAWILSELALGMVATPALRRLYEMWEPSCVISTSNLCPFDCTAFVEAHRLGIPSFVVQHGLIDCYWWPFVGSKLLLWGTPFENEMRTLGAPAEQLAACGMPAADRLFNRYRANAATRRPEKPASSYVVLSHTHARVFDPVLYSDYGNLLKAVVAATPSVHWSIKLHPIEEESFYRGLRDAHLPNFTVLPKSTTLEEAVTGADVACTLFSAAGLEAMMMRRPLVVFDVAGIVRETAWWPARGGGTYVPTAAAMIEFVGKASADRTFLADLVKQQDQFLAESFSNPGGAAEMILNIVEGLALAASADAAPSVHSESAVH
jgi:hypothetical protein